LVKRILTNTASCSVRRYSKDPPDRDFLKDPIPTDYTHLEGEEQVGLLGTDEVLTPEKRAALAAKYNLRPEDYIPLNDKDLNLGDYPKLPYEHCLERDAYYDWDDTYFRRNYGEPINHDIDLMQPLFGVDTRPTPLDRPQMSRFFFTWLGLFFLAVFIGHKYKYFPEKAPKQYPEFDPMDGRRAAVYEHDYMEGRWTSNPKILERKEVVNYAFPGGWNPLAH